MGREWKEGKSQRRAENTIRRGAEEVAGSTLSLTKGKTRLPNSKNIVMKNH